MIEVWIGRAGKRNGPYPSGTVLAAHGAGKLQPTDLLWWQGLDQWEPVATAIGKLSVAHGAGSIPADVAAVDGGLALEPIQAPAPQPAVPVAAAPEVRTAGAGVHTASGPENAQPGRLQRGGEGGHGLQAEATAPLANAPYAGFWIRFLAVIIDGILVAIAQSVIVALFFVRWRSGPIDAGLVGVQLVSFVLAWIYSAGFESSSWLATPGKRVLGLRVVAADSHERISFLRATGRFFARFLSWMLLMIGYLMQPFTARRQALHDMIAGTVVVRI